MTAMVAVALVVHEDHAKIGGFTDGLREVTTVHVGVPARLEHERAANVVGVLLQPGATRDDGLARHLWQTARDDAKRLASGMNLDRAKCLRDFHIDSR